MKNMLLLLIIIIAGFIAVFFLWPRSVDLPKLGSISAPQLFGIDGKVFQFSNDKPKLITFYYTNCPDICPMTLMDLKDLETKLNDEGVSVDEYEVILVTLDPEVDTVERIGEYKKSFEISSKNWFFLSGSTEETQRFTKQFNMVYKQAPDGFITHTTTMYLLDSQNNIRSYHDMATKNKAVNLDQLTSNILALLK